MEHGGIVLLLKFPTVGYALLCHLAHYQWFIAVCNLYFKRYINLVPLSVHPAQDITEIVCNWNCCALL